jgi:hypothetical protein
VEVFLNGKTTLTRSLWNFATSENIKFVTKKNFAVIKGTKMPETLRGDTYSRFLHFGSESLKSLWRKNHRGILKNPSPELRCNFLFPLECIIWPFVLVKLMGTHLNLSETVKEQIAFPPHNPNPAQSRNR